MSTGLLKPADRGPPAKPAVKTGPERSQRALAEGQGESGETADAEALTTRKGVFGMC